MQLTNTELTAASWGYGALCMYKVGSSVRRARLLCWHHDVPVPIWPHMTPSPRPTFQRCLQSARPPPHPPVSERIHGDLTRRSEVQHLVRRGAWRADRETVAWKYGRMRCDICICVSLWSLWHMSPWSWYDTCNCGHVLYVWYVTVDILTHVTVIIIWHMTLYLLRHMSLFSLCDTCHCSHYDTWRCSHYDTWRCSHYDTCHCDHYMTHDTVVIMTHVTIFIMWHMSL